MKDKIINIVIIGVGNLGKRHLEATINTKIEKKIYCVDTNLEIEEFCEKLNKGRGGIYFLNDIQSLPKEIEIAIIATSAGIRKKIFDDLINHSSVKNIIFEKVLFQKMEDYYSVKEKLDALNINAWVNCARREWPSYQKLKNEMDKNDEFEIHISGGNWGLACNGVHMIDLIKFLDGTGECKITKLLLDSEIVDSKRKGYKEVFGTIIGEGGKCKSFSISCYKDSMLPFEINIIGNRSKYTIYEGKQFCYYASEENEWKIEEEKFDIYYQSQLTDKVVESICITGNCNLAKYEESMNTHLVYIEPLVDFFEEKGLERGICPIT